MTKNYAKLSGMGTTSTLTPQTQKAAKGQKRNNAGGYSFKADDWTRLNRFLILGSESPTYYQSAQKLTKQNANVVEKLIKKGEGKKVVDTAVEISNQGRAYKNGPALFVLALAASYTSKDDSAYATEVRQYAFENLHKVARIGTHLFEFVAYADSLRGWGKAFQKAIANWYNNKPAEKVAYQVCKYASRRLEGDLPWSHRDLLRKTHLKPSSDDHNVIFKYVTKGRESFSDNEWQQVRENDKLAYIWAHEEVKNVDKESDVKSLIKEYSLSQESIPTEWKKNTSVGKQLLQNMPITATIRGLGKMTANEVLKPLSKETSLVCERITNEDLIQKGRVHPLQFLAALKAYKQNNRHVYNPWVENRSGTKSSLQWKPIDAICDALEEGFYKAFKYVEPTGKNYLFGVDVSGSMRMPCAGVNNLSCAEGAAAMAMTIARTEKNYQIRGFSGNFVDLGVTAKDSLSSALNKTDKNNFGGTDCSLPMKYALDKKLDVDVFIVITDSETWAGRNGHAHEVLKQYRSSMNKPDAKLVVMGMAGNNFSIADPNDPGMLDVVGFDANVPSIINEFVRGNI